MSNDCNGNSNLIKKAIKKIKQDSKYKSECTRSIVGPTGPTGPQGPATLTIGNTVTSNPGTSASVTNVGTDTNAILNFKIPSGIPGPQGEQGIQGPTGPAGPKGMTLQKAAYLVKFNDGTQEDGIPVATDERIPLDRAELNIGNIITLNTIDRTIKFNSIGYYKIMFTISAYPLVNSPDFDPATDIVSIGFRQINTDNAYIGVGEWVFNGEAVELIANGIISINNTENLYELVNLSKQTIYLNTPNLKNISSISYFSNPLVTITIEYLGKQE